MIKRIPLTVLQVCLSLVVAAPLIATADRDDGNHGRSFERNPSRSETQRPHRQSDRPVRSERRDLPRATPAPVMPRTRETGNSRTPKVERREYRNAPSRSAPIARPPAGYVLDKRHSHNQYYPPQGQTIKKLPSGHRDVEYRGSHYHYYRGVWYRPSNGVYIVTRPPLGLTIRFLPPFYTVIWVGAIPYYYAAGVYYAWYPEFGYYRVVEAPRDSEIRDQGPMDDIYFYPRNGQSAEQQAQDRYECHRWAMDQTRFDPTAPGGNVPVSQYNGKRSDYRRAMKACLEARSYSVQ